MRLASRGPDFARQERADRLRRERAAAQPLRVTFPKVQLLRLELSFEGTANPPTFQAHEMHPAARAYFEFPCPFANCSGQFDLNVAVNEAMAHPEHQAHGSLACRGSRAGANATAEPCQLHLSYRITATCG